VRRKAPLTSVDAHRDSLSRTHPERVA
jgi:hypothetical protein